MVVTAVVLIADGSFGMKLGTGFSSISASLRSLFEAPGDIIGAAHLINEYHNLSAAAFEARHGAEAINGVLAYLNGGITYLQEVGQNFASQPFATFFASVISFCCLYFISLVIRFARQKGQGSFLNQLERRLGERVFESQAKRKRQRMQQQSRTVANANRVNGHAKPRPKPKSVNKVKKTFGNNSGNGKVNKHLQDYLKSAQGSS